MRPRNGSGPGFSAKAGPDRTDTLLATALVVPFPYHHPVRVSKPRHVTPWPWQIRGSLDPEAAARRANRHALADVAAVAAGADKIGFVLRSGTLKFLSRSERQKWRRALRAIASGDARIKDRVFLDWVVKKVVPAMRPVPGSSMSVTDITTSPLKRNVHRDGARIPREGSSHE
jgi:hypothetical protein